MLGRFTLVLYLGAIFTITVIIGAGLLALLRGAGLDGWRLAFLGILSLLGASQLASSLTNWLATLLAAPQLLPRMDFSQGLPPELHTLVVIPTLLSSPQNIEELLDALEVRFLGNQDRHLKFGLLSDFCDAKAEILDDDEPLLRQARDGIEKLNEKYFGSGNAGFFLFHRPRRWNRSERIWMGYERKRGKLADLNLLLRGAGRDRFSALVGDVAALSNVRYVITLDTDTQLPRDSARQLVAVMAHPLNRPRFDERRKRVCGGYGILQPRMATGLPGANRSRFAQLYGSEAGIDPYTRSVSDVYQDLFGEGSFIGKGIYDVDAFERALKDRFPENRILSHDLLEGCYARSGLLSDVLLYEDYPSRYEVEGSRHERWIRGDWQIARWLLPRVQGPDRRSQPNPLSSLSRWKIFDNLRRSLVSTTLVLLLLVGWCVAPRAWSWTLAVVGLVLVPPFLVAVVESFRKPKELSLGRHLASVLRTTGRNFAQAGFGIACLPYEAVISLGAVLRTAWRKLITRRRLLEWSPYEAQDQRGTTSVFASYGSMWSAPFLAGFAVIALALSRPDALTAAVPVLGLWLAAPGLAWWLSRPLERREAKLTLDQGVFLRRIARKTWAFFERFVGAADHWLPPDNFQEDPGPVIAHRTSPTNIGLTLLANLSACDFGFITAGSFIERTAATFGTMAQLPRHHGHFYNWYDTQTLQPLPPRYISSVDSGNLAGHLLTLRSGLIALPDQEIVGIRLFDGLSDTLAILTDIATEKDQVTISRLQAQLKAARDLRPATLPAAMHCLEALADCVATISAGAETVPDGEALDWARALARQCRDALDELRFLAPWLSLPVTPGGLDGLADFHGIPTLRDLAARTSHWLPVIDATLQAALTSEDQDRLTELRGLIATAGDRAVERIAACERMALEATGFAEMDYEFLYDRPRHLLAVGYNVDEFRRDNSFYDLLASEARLGSFVAVAQGQLPQECWFALGRMLTTTEGEPVLVSWSGSMFEYLMPLLIMPTYE
ncbi:MAG: hypothetical protein WBO00_07585, partial [Steroidobacteraceae bacterium]